MRLGREAHHNNRYKLRFLASVKMTFGRENYIKNLKMKDASVIFNFRASNHNLPIERDRYNEDPNIKRICRKCDLDQVGDEYHVFVCPFYRSWQVRMANVLCMNKKINIEKAVEESKIVSNYNNNINDMEACRDIMYGDDGLIRHLFACIPRVFIHFFKNFWSPFHMENWFC